MLENFVVGIGSISFAMGLHILNGGSVYVTNEWQVDSKGLAMYLIVQGAVIALFGWFGLDLLLG